MKTIAIIYLTPEPELKKFAQHFQKQETSLVELTWDPTSSGPLVERLSSEAFDSLCFVGVGMDSALSSLNLTELMPVIYKAYQESLPLGAIGLGRFLIASALKKHTVTLAISANETPTQQKIYSHVLWEACPQDDFISDRETKVVSHCGFIISDLESQQVQLGLQRFAQEIFEWA